MPSNSERAAWAQAALAAFAAKTGQDKGDLQHDKRSVIVDLLCDLMHLCEREEDMNFSGCVESGRGHFEAEGGARHALDDIATMEDARDHDVLFFVRYWDEDEEFVIETVEIIYNPSEDVPDMDGVRQRADEEFGDMSLDPCALTATIDGPFYLRNAVKTGPRESLRVVAS